MVDSFDTLDTQQQHYLEGRQIRTADHHKSLGHLVSPKNPESHDQYLLDAAEQAGFSTHALRFINYCRIYLNVISLADITDESGMRIDSSVLKQKEIPQRDEDSGLIQQKKPDCTKWLTWFKFLKTLLRPRQSTLKVPLGAWTAGYSNIRKKFRSYRTSDKLYRVQTGTNAEHSVIKVLGKNGSVKNLSTLMLSLIM